MREHSLSHCAAFLCGGLLALSCHGQPSDKIVIDGSTGVTPLAGALARAFQQRAPNVVIEIGKGLGTKARIEALAEGKIGIALASHGLNVADITRRGMAAHEIARTAVVFGAHASVTLGNLTDQQVCDIYAGRVPNWKTFGGPDLAIAPRTRPDTEVDAEVVRAGIKCLADLRKPELVKVMPRAGDMAQELAATDGAIGMTSMTIVEQSGGKIRALAINGTVPSAENVERKTYPLVREAFFVTKAVPEPAVTRFLDFVRSADGERLIRANGATPVR